MKVLKNSFNLLLKNLSSIEDILKWTVNIFIKSNIWFGHGTDNAWDEARYLIFSLVPHSFKKSHINLHEKLNISIKRYIIHCVMQRVEKRFPVAYLINKSWFCGHEFYIDERTLIPRSPISELITNRFKKIIQREPEKILDLCTGSGCIAISCAYIFPNSKIDATDISFDALKVAKKNIQTHNFNNKIFPIHSNLFFKLKKEKYDLIISNPPYVSKNSIYKLPLEYRHEPKIALLGGNDGLKFVYNILLHAAYYLTPKGILICEVGDHMDFLKKKYPKINFTWLTFKYGGHGVFMLNKKQLLNGKKYLNYTEKQ